MEENVEIPAARNRRIDPATDVFVAQIVTIDIRGQCEDAQSCRGYGCIGFVKNHGEQRFRNIMEMLVNTIDGRVS